MHRIPAGQQSPKQQASSLGQQAASLRPNGQHCSWLPQQTESLIGSVPGPHAVSPRSKAQQPSLVQISNTSWPQHSSPQTFSSGQQSAGALHSPSQQT
jgi:hypothetical protein